MTDRPNLPPHMALDEERPNLLPGHMALEMELYRRLLEHDYNPAVPNDRGDLAVEMLSVWRDVPFGRLEEVAGVLGRQVCGRTTHDDLIKNIVGTWASKLADHRAAQPKLKVGDKVFWDPNPWYKPVIKTVIVDTKPGRVEIERTSTRRFWVDADDVELIED